MGKHSTPDPAAPPSNLLRDILARRRLAAAALGAVLTVLLGLVLWVVDQPDGGLANGSGGGAGASVTGARSPSDAGLPLASAGTPLAAVESQSPSATPSPHSPSGSPSVSAVPAPAPAGLTAAFTQKQFWDGGYEAQYTVTNRGTAAVTGWTVVVTFSGTVTFTYWDTDAVTGTNNRISFTAKSYNATVPAGGSASFGLVVRGSPPATPLACTVNGRAC